MAISKPSSMILLIAICQLLAFSKNKAPAAAEAPSSKLAALLLDGLFVLAAETLDASGGVHQLLLAGKERMAIGADFHVDRALVRGPGNELVAARAVYAYFIVSGMNRCFH